MLFTARRNSQANALAIAVLCVVCFSAGVKVLTINCQVNMLIIKGNKLA